MAYELFGFCNIRNTAWNKQLVYYTTDGYGPLIGYNANNLVRTLKRSKKYRDISAQFAKKGKKILKPGDILVNSNQVHAGLIVTKNRIVEGCLNENRQEYQASIPGDQRGGREMKIENYMSPSYSFSGGIKYVFRPIT